MKHTFIAALCLCTSLAWSIPSLPTSSPETENPSLNSDKLFRVKFCFGPRYFSVCIEFDCDLHWTDIIVPGSGQLLGHKGCVPVGSVTAADGITRNFDTDDGMVQQIERAMNQQTGTLKFLEVIKTPTFPGPDGNNYRVIPKTYPVLQGDNGRYIPIQAEKIIE